MTAHPAQRGTTLVELLVVLVLLGLLAAISAGNLASLRTPEGDRWADRVRRARSQAIQRGVPVLVRGDSGWIRLLPDGQTLGQSDARRLRGAAATEQVRDTNASRIRR